MEAKKNEIRKNPHDIDSVELEKLLEEATAKDLDEMLNLLRMSPEELKAYIRSEDEKTPVFSLRDHYGMKNSYKAERVSFYGPANKRDGRALINPKD